MARNKCFYTQSAGADKGEYRLQERIVIEHTAHFHCFLMGEEAVHIYDHQVRRGDKILTAAAGECAAGSHIR